MVISVCSTEFSLLESLPSPFGVSTGGSIVVSGTVSGFSGLVTGKAYYTNTMGQLVSGGVYYGSAATAWSSPIYVTSPDGKMLISSDSLVGVAIATDTILILK